MRAKRLATAVVAVSMIATMAVADPVIVVSDDMDLPQTVITSEGTYIVIPNYTTGKPMAVIEATDSDKDD